MRCPIVTLALPLQFEVEEAEETEPTKLEKLGVNV